MRGLHFGDGERGVLRDHVAHLSKVAQRTAFGGRLTGAAVAQTAPGRVVLAFVKAAAAGDKGALHRLMTADYGKPLDGPNGKATLAQWKANPLDPAKAPFGTAFITGNTAEVVMVDKSTGAMTAKFNLSLVAGEWKIDGAMM